VEVSTNLDHRQRTPVTSRTVPTPLPNFWQK
jgi:hypothetical protein